jgi:hypothetical protein
MKKLDILQTGASRIAVIAIGIASLVAGAFFLNARVADFWEARACSLISSGTTSLAFYWSGSPRSF